MCHRLRQRPVTPSRPGTSRSPYATAPSTETATASSAPDVPRRCASMRLSTHVATAATTAVAVDAQGPDVDGKHPYLAALGPDPDNPARRHRRVATQCSHQSRVAELDAPIRLASARPHHEQRGPAPHQRPDLSPALEHDRRPPRTRPPVVAPADDRAWDLRPMHSRQQLRRPGDRLGAHHGSSPSGQSCVPRRPPRCPDPGCRGRHRRVLDPLGQHVTHRPGGAGRMPMDAAVHRRYADGASSRPRRGHEGRRPTCTARGSGVRCGP